MPITPTYILRKRQRKQLEDIAATRGYESLHDMLYGLYITDQTPLIPLAESLAISTVLLRKIMKESGIKLRSKGGPNNLRVDLSDDLIREICRDGVQATSERIGVDYATLLERLKNFKGDVDEILRKGSN